MNRLILFLIRVKLGLKKYESFRFINQKTTAVYYFTSNCIIKDYSGRVEPSTVSLNYILSKECKIKRIFPRLQ